MSLRTLPEIQALDAPGGLSFEAPLDAVEAFDPATRAAAETDDNVVSIYGPIGEDMFGEGVSSKRIAAALRRIGARDVVANLHSPGGSFFEGVAIYNLLRQHPARVTVQVMGLAASAGSVIAMAGDEILIPDAGLMMIHNARAMVSGDRREMAYANTMLATFDDAMASVYAARSGLEKDAVAEMMNRDTWFNGAEALAAGLADGILAPEKVTQTDEPGAKATAAIRKVDAALARQGLSRQERRSLLGELKGGKPGAAATATHDAGALTADLRRLIETLQ